MPTFKRKYRRSKKTLDEDDESRASPITPHPYHSNDHPPLHDQPDLAASRTASQKSNVAGSVTDDSQLEYSDTSDDLREDRYFSHPKPEPGSMLLDQSRSTFRNLRPSTRTLYKVVGYSSPSLKSDTIEDESEGSPDLSVLPSFHDVSPPIPGKDSKKSKSWVTNLAHSFRSPQRSSLDDLDNPDFRNQEKASAEPKPRPRPSSSSTMEYPSNLPLRNQERASGGESQPLINRSLGITYGIGSTSHDQSSNNGNGNGVNNAMIKAEPKTKNIRSRSLAALTAAYYLMDYEGGRPPTLSPNFETITPEQLSLYRIHYSWIWRWFGVNFAIVLLFMANSENRLLTVLMHTYAIFIFLIEIWMKETLLGPDHSRDFEHPDRALVSPLLLFLFALGVESWTRLFLQTDVIHDEDAFSRPFMLTTSIFKPIVLFYISHKARHALEALSRIGRIVSRVIWIELFLILSFAAVACRLYRDHETFQSLAVSWLSLFELSTTVVNPSLWMPMYEANQSNALFFIVFTIICGFYVHSLVLSVVFQTYIQAATDIHKRSTYNREETIRLAFLALVRDGETECISTSSVRKTLQAVRPHYSVMKIKALMDIVNPDSESVIDYPTFRTKIRHALNASIRTTRSGSTFAMGVEIIAVMVAILNFIYVILLTSELDSAWFDTAAFWFGTAITWLGLLELVIRFNPLRISNFAPLTRLNVTFDGLALLAALVSIIGMIQYNAGNYDIATDYILMGRAIDMIRIMRFFQIFRDVVRRSSEVFPVMTGPIVLVLTSLHMFVYVGMHLWGGAIDGTVLVENTQITPLYYFNNFNSYAKGLVTMFNVFVVNDWHAIAKVFLYANRCSSPMIVYPFFVFSICFGVFIMLNVLTAFFVEAFVTKLGDKDNTGNQNHDEATAEKSHDFQIHSGSRVRKIASIRTLEGDQESTYSGRSNNLLETSKSTESFSFDVYEREGFDQIMSQVNKKSSDQDDFAQNVCDYFEVFEGLAAGREKVGYMVCCQQSMNRFGNRRFQNQAVDYMEEDILQKIVNDMHSELLVLTSSKNFSGRCLVRTFAHKTNPSLKLEISASLLRHQPAVSLLVSRIRPFEQGTRS